MPSIQELAVGDPVYIAHPSLSAYVGESYNLATVEKVTATQVVVVQKRNGRQRRFSRKDGTEVGSGSCRYTRPYLQPDLALVMKRAAERDAHRAVWALMVEARDALDNALMHRSRLSKATVRELHREVSERMGKLLDTARNLPE